MAEIIFKVEGMACAKCEARIKDKILSLTGITSVVASAADKTVTVTGSNLDKSALEEAIFDLGFDVI